MAATSFGTLVNQTRRYLKDWPDLDQLTAALTDTTGTTVTVADTTMYSARWPIEVDQELMMIRAVASGTTLTVRRGAYGSTAATHLNGAAVNVRPAFAAVEIMDALNEAIYATWPLLYKPVLDTSLATVDSSYEYTVPNMPGSYRGRTIILPRIYGLEVKRPGDLTYRELKRWGLNRGASPILKLRSPEPAGGTLRVKGYGPFPDLVLLTDTVDPLFPPDAEYLLPVYAAGSLLLSGEAGRVRVDAAAVDQREQANRVGGAAAIGSQLLARFRQELASCAMPPMPRHVKATV